MRLDFEDKSYINIFLSAHNKVAISIGAKNASNPLQTIVNSLEITYDEFKKLVEDLNIIEKDVEKTEIENNKQNSEMINETK